MSTSSGKTAYELLLNFQTRLQGVGNTLAAEISKLISQTDPAVIKTVVARFPSGRTISVRAQMAALERMMKVIETQRKKGFDLAEKAILIAGLDIARSAGKTVRNIAIERGVKRFVKELSQRQIGEILRYHPVDGKSISQWFSKIRSDDLSRITQTVQRASVEGMSVARVVRAIRGTKETGYQGGILETTRQPAIMTGAAAIMRTSGGLTRYSS